MRGQWAPPAPEGTSGVPASGSPPVSPGEQAALCFRGWPEAPQGECGPSARPLGGCSMGGAAPGTQPTVSHPPSSLGFTAFNKFSAVFEERGRFPPLSPCLVLGDGLWRLLLCLAGERKVN